MTSSAKIQPGVYQHFKGNKYLVLTTAKHSETLEEMVVYITLYDNPAGQVWVRPAAMFQEMVKQNDELTPRFKKVSD